MIDKTVFIHGYVFDFFTDPKDIMLNLLSQLETFILSIEHKGKRKALHQKKQTQYKTQKALNVQNLVKDFDKNLEKSKELEIKVTIVIDGLEKITQDKTSTQVRIHYFK